MGKMGNYMTQSPSKFVLILYSGIKYFFLRQYSLEARKETQSPGGQSSVVPSHVE